MLDYGWRLVKAHFTRITTREDEFSGAQECALQSYGVATGVSASVAFTFMVNQCFDFPFHFPGINTESYAFIYYIHSYDIGPDSAVASV
jgi:hypothetical protein